MNLGKISSFLSVGSALFAFFGMLKLYIFYKFFAIDILYFVTVTDLFNASLEGLFIGFIYLPTILIALALIRRKNVEPSTSLRKTFIKQPVFWLLLIVLYIIIVYSWGWHYKELLYNKSIKFLIVISFFTPFIAAYGLNKLLFLMKLQPLKLSEKILLTSILFIGLLYISSAYKDVKFLERGYHMSTKVYLKDKNILIGSDSTYYIGNTSQYLFFHDKSNGKYTTTAYPMSDIEKVEF